MINKSLKQILRDGKEYIRHLKYKDTLPKNPMHDDIFIIEFPKSGITWLSHILGNIELALLNKSENITFYNHHKYIIDIHQIRGSNIRRTLNRTFIKSHAQFNPYYFFNIYLIRNPFDTMISYYNYNLGFGYKDSFEIFLKDENLGIKSWLKHVKSWHYCKNDPQKIHFLKYEDLITNAENEIKILYKNLGVSLSESIISNAIEKSNMKQMKIMEQHYAQYNPNRTLNFVGKDKKIPKKDLLTKELEEYIFDISKDELKVFYPEIYKKLNK